jgi:protoporphyrinogen oxidase
MLFSLLSKGFVIIGTAVFRVLKVRYNVIWAIWATHYLFRYLFLSLMNKRKTAIIIGAGPAGLTAALELLRRTDFHPVVIERSDDVGGISRTVDYHGNRMDIGGHRFFSKSDRVMNWWLDIFPLADQACDPDSTDRVMLIRQRLSRIFYGRKFYDYPVRLNGNTIRNLGVLRIARIGLSYVKARLRPVVPENNLEDFFINRFGRELYQTFFKDYTEKVWGVTCDRITPEWGAQRVKGLSVSTALWHALKSIFPSENSVRQKSTETSLIDRFLYPKFGPGHLWKEVASQIISLGGEIRMNHRVTGLNWEQGRICAVRVIGLDTGEEMEITGDVFFSTMPVRDLIAGMGRTVPESIRAVSDGLIYRDFIAIGLLFRKMALCPAECIGNNRVPDNWIYIQESDVKVGRIQVFNNWSPYLVKDPDTVWLGLEYFCVEGDEMWRKPDDELIGLGVAELEKTGFCRKEDYLDGTVVRMEKTYPAYFGTYDRFGLIRAFTDSFPNLFLLGRNGMHRYNNQDHSMLTAMTAVDLLIGGSTDKDAVWAVNTEEDYHEDHS